VGFSNLFDLRGFSHKPKLLKLTINFQPAAHFDRLQLAERNVAPFRVLKVVIEDREAPEEVFSIKLSAGGSACPAKEYALFHKAEVSLIACL
jgi:hypothetical protein